VALASDALATVVLATRKRVAAWNAAVTPRVGNASGARRRTLEIPWNRIARVSKSVQQIRVPRLKSKLKSIGKEAVIKIIQNFFDLF